MKNRTRTEKAIKSVWIVLATFLLLSLVVALIFGFTGKYSVVRNELVKGNTSPISFREKVYTYNHNLINILCLGIDKDKPMNKEELRGNLGQSDAIYLVSIDKETKEVKILNIPRDSIVPVSVYDKNSDFVGIQSMQITLQHAYGKSEEEGCRMTASAVSRLLGDIPIHRCCAINFSAIPALNDAVGGVEVTFASDYVDKELQKISDRFRPGETVHLMGDESYNYLRIRDVDLFASSMERVERQKEYIKGFKEALLQSMKEDKKLLTNVYNILQDTVYTDVSKSEMAYLATMAGEFQELGMESLPGEVTHDEKHEKYFVDEEGKKEVLTSMFYEEVTE